jgi:hypothetical protein
MGILFAAVYPLGRENFTQLANDLEMRRKAKNQNPV